MISGVVAASGSTTGGGGGGGLTPNGILDFLNESYSWNGAALVASDVIDQPSFVHPSAGLMVPGQPTPVNLIYSAMTTFLGNCQFTMVLELDLLVVGGFPGAPFTQLFWMSNAGFAYYVQCYYQNDWVVDTGDGVTNPFVDIFDHLTTGVHKVAFTQTNTRTSLSVDGLSVVTDTTGVALPKIGFPMSVFWFGNDSNSQPFNMYRCDIYDPVADVLLPTLST